MASVLMHDFPPCNPSWEIPVFEIEGRHILVTGGSGGLGQHFARFLANNGAHITLAARRAEALAQNVPGVLQQKQPFANMLVRVLSWGARADKGDSPSGVDAA
jgi:NAD(P)-dependent dehydrogenase (short-subunit alcohol dehydrogenase family)